MSGHAEETETAIKIATIRDFYLPGSFFFLLETDLSEYVFPLKDKEMNYVIKGEIVRNSIFSRGKMVYLCLEEKYAINCVEKLNTNNMLSKGSGLIIYCRHGRPPNHSNISHL